MSAEVTRRRVAVVGSGAAGVSCAMALLGEGLDVTILDGGERLEPAQREFVERKSEQRHDTWTNEDRRRLRGETQASARGIPRKFSFGSDFPFRDPAGIVGLNQIRTEILYSLAQGGLTTMWGANVLPWREADFDRWPFARTELEPHYRAVLNFMPFSAAFDDLAADFPLYCDLPTRLHSSPQARALMLDLDRHREQLRRDGITFGGARLAVRVAKEADPASGCEYCSECLYGCVYGHIYSAAQTLPRLIALGARYEAGSVVLKVEESSAGVAVTCRLFDGNERRLEFDRVFLAAGVIPTAQLIMEAREMIEQHLTIRDSQYFIVPFLRWKGVKEFSNPGSYSLSQIFLEMDGQKAGQRAAHVQFYSYSEIYRDVLAKMFPRLVRIMPGMIDAFLSRLFIIQGYLHSEESGTMTLTLTRPAPGKRGVLELQAQPNATSLATVRALLSRVIRHAWAVGGVPVLPMLDLPHAGKSYHAGGSFPMAAAPGPLETDRLGRLGGRGRIHLVDASVLPNVAATTVTFTVMANAHRIAQEAARLSA